MALLPFPCKGVATLAMVTRIGMISKGAAARFSTSSSSFVSLSQSSTTSTRPLHHNFLQRRSPCHIIAAPSMVDDSSLPKISNTRRHFSTNGVEEEEDTLPNKTGDRNGLIRYQITADDGHPLRLYSRAPTTDTSSSVMNMNASANNKPSILLLHGRTWSSQPVFDLRTSDNDEKQQSTIQSLTNLGFHVYAMDLRGFGETPRCDNDGGYTTPNRCVEDVKCAIDWIARRHDANHGRNHQDDNNNVAESLVKMSSKPALLGWSQGALVAQMYAQKYGPATISDLVLFGTIYDPRVIYPRKPLYDPSGQLISGGKDAVKPPAPEVLNTVTASLEDFTLPGKLDSRVCLLCWLDLLYLTQNK